MSDPTMASLAKLKDESQWRIVRNVPIFIPIQDRVKMPDGTLKEVQVSDLDLYEICLNYSRRMETTGDVGRITAGHIKPLADESAQPTIYGHPMNLRVGSFGPENKLCILADFYIRPECWEDFKRYPYRSPEYYHDRKEITGVALLIRDPKLDLGMLTYSGRLNCFYFAMEGEPAIDPTKPPMANPEKPADVDGAKGAEDKLPHEHLKPPDGIPKDFYGHFMNMMRHHFPQMYGTLSFPGGMSAAMPAAGRSEPAHMQRTEPVSTLVVTPPVTTVAPVADAVRDQQAIQFARMQLDITALQAELAAAKAREAETQLQFSRADCEKRCAQLEYEGYSLSQGWKDEVAIMLSRDAAGRDSYCQYVREHHKPTGQALMRPEHQSFVHTVDSPTLFRRDDADELSDGNLALQFQRENPDWDWDKCKEMVKEKKTKKMA